MCIRLVQEHLSGSTSLVKGFRLVTYMYWKWRPSIICWATVTFSLISGFGHLLVCYFLKHPTLAESIGLKAAISLFVFFYRCLSLPLLEKWVCPRHHVSSITVHSIPSHFSQRWKCRVQGAKPILSLSSQKQSISWTKFDIIWQDEQTHEKHWSSIQSCQVFSERLQRRLGPQIAMVVSTLLSDDTALGWDVAIASSSKDFWRWQTHLPSSPGRVVWLGLIS